MVAGFLKVDICECVCFGVNCYCAEFDFVRWAVWVVECGFPHARVSEFVKDFVAVFVGWIVVVVFEVYGTSCWVEEDFERVEIVEVVCKREVDGCVYSV